LKSRSEIIDNLSERIFKVILVFLIDHKMIMIYF